MKFKKGLSAVLVCSLLVSNTFAVYADDANINTDNVSVEEETDSIAEAEDNEVDDAEAEDTEVGGLEAKIKAGVIMDNKYIFASDTSDTDETVETENADSNSEENISEEDISEEDISSGAGNSLLSAMAATTDTNFVEYKAVGKNEAGEDVEYQLNIKYNYTFNKEVCGQVLTVSKTQACSMVIPETITYQDSDGNEQQVYVRSIEESAFQNCKATSIVLPKTVKEIGKDAFRSSPNLKSVVVNSSTYEYHETADDDGEVTGSYSFFTTTIGEGAFRECPNLESVELSGFKTIGASIFADCTALKNVTLNFDNMYTALDSKTKLPKSAATATMGDYCFQNCTALESVTLPNNLKTVGKNGFFEGCTALKTVYIGLDLSSGLSVSSFTNCDALEEIHVAGEDASPYLSNAVIETEETDEDGNPITIDNRWNTTYRSIDGALYSGVKKVDAVVGEDGYNVQNDEGTNLKRFNVTTLVVYPAAKKDTVYQAPETLTSISESVFANHKYVTELIIDTVPTYTSTFNKNNELVTLTKKDATVTIGKSAFTGCLTLTSVTINNVCAVSSYAFDGCTSLSELVHENAESDILSTIGDYSFRNCGLTSLAPKYWVSIGKGAFTGNEQLKDVVLDGTVGSLGESAFSDCTALESVDMYDLGKLTSNSTTVTMSTGLFTGCTALESVVLPENLLQLGSNTFKGCTSLTDVDFSENVAIIGSSAFEGCTALEEITPSKYLVKIETNAFKGCTSLNRVNLTRSVKSIITKKNYESFNGCTALTDSSTGAIVAPTGSYAEQFANDNSIDIIYTDNDIRDSDYLQYGWVSLGKDVSATAGYQGKYLKLDDSVYYVYAVIGYRGGFEKLTFSESETPYLDENFISTPTVSGATNKSWLQAVDLTGMSVIGAKAFYGCDALTTAVFDDELMSIGDSAFYNCKSLFNFDIWEMDDPGIGESGKVVTSTDETYELVLPSTCTSLGSKAFYNCTAIQAADLSDISTDIPVSLFNGCTSLKSVKVGDGVTSIGATAFSGCTALEDVELSDNINAIGEGAFTKCKSLKKIALPNELIKLEKNTFSGCEKLQRVTFNPKLERIGTGAFLNCTSLETITLNRNIFLEADGFKGCTGLKTIVIPDAANIVSTRDPFPSSTDCVILCTDTSQATVYTDAKGYTAQTVEFVDGINYAIIKVSLNIADDVTVTNAEGTALTSNDYVVVDDVLDIALANGGDTSNVKFFVNDEVVTDTDSVAEYVVQEHDYALNISARYIGDIDGNKVTNMSDAAYLLKYLAGVYEPDETQLAVADVNEDGTVDMLDAIEIVNLSSK